MRRDLLKLGENVRKEVKDELRNVANKTHKTAIAGAPISTDNPSKIHLHEVIGQKVSEDGLEIAIGATRRIIGAHLFRTAGWYAHFVLGGTRGGVVTHGPYRGAVIPPMPANNYMQRALDQHEAEYIQRVGGAAKRAVQKSRGSTGRLRR